MRCFSACRSACALACLLVSWQNVALGSPKPPLSVQSAIETTRAMADRNGESIHIAPDGKRYAVMLIRGDIERDGVWAELRVGRLDSLEGAEPRVIARLFTSALGGGYRRYTGSEELVHQRANAPRWLDNGHLALLWEDERTLRQAISVEIASGRVRYLTRHDSDVVHFNVHANGTLVYGGRVLCALKPDAADYHNGFVVEANDARELLLGCNPWERAHHDLFVVSKQHPEPRRIEMIDGDTVNRTAPAFPGVLFDPGGRRALFATTVTEIPAEWRMYQDAHFSAMLKSLGDRSGGYSSQFRKLFVIDLERAQGKPLWDAAQEPYYRMRASWSPDGRSLVLGPTFLPHGQAGKAGLAGDAVAEVDVASGEVNVLPVATSDARQIASLRWCASDCIEVASAAGPQRYRKRAAAWVREAPSKLSASVDRNAAEVRVELRQGLNEPPALYAIERGGRERLLFDLNPDLKQYKLGRVEWLERRRPDGSVWEGRLFYPSHYRADRRYPLLVQTHSLAPRDEFTLYGRGVYSGATGPGVSVYLGQILAGRDIFVLHGRVRGFPKEMSYLERTQEDIAQNEALIAELAAAGKIDPTRVGLMGYSATGWDVSYALAHSSFPYAAALTDDNKDGSYLQAAFTGWMYGTTEEMIGEAPFGEGLKAWIERSPAMNADRIHTPLLLTVTGPGGELSGWEMFSRLRHLGKPVEYYFVPDLEHGSHGLQNPRQVRALQERALDWWCFWLKDEEGPAPAKSDQYVRWRKLRQLHAHNMSMQRSSARIDESPSVPAGPN